MEDITIKIADWSTTPGARTISTGKYSAEEYYNTILGPVVESAAEANRKLTIDLDGTAGYASSFLDEIAHRIGKDASWNWLCNKLVIVSTEEPYLAEELEGYITDHWLPY